MLENPKRQESGPEKDRLVGYASVVCCISERISVLNA
jgi:hypothetical protein